MVQHIITRNYVSQIARKTALRVFIYILCLKKKPLFWRQFRQILTDFQNSVTDGKYVKFAKKQCMTLFSTSKICCYVIADVTEVFVSMVCSDKDKILIKHLYQLKEYNAKELMSIFLNKRWTK